MGHLNDGCFLAKERREYQDMLDALPDPTEEEVLERAWLDKLANDREREHRHDAARKLLADPYAGERNHAMARAWLEY